MFTIICCLYFTVAIIHFMVFWYLEYQLQQRVKKTFTAAGLKYAAPSFKDYMESGVCDLIASMFWPGYWMLLIYVKHIKGRSL